MNNGVHQTRLPAKDQYSAILNLKLDIPPYRMVNTLVKPSITEITIQ
jgi:hypothetical protein